MEKPALTKKTGPIPCKSTTKVESIADFSSQHEEGSDSGIGLNGMPRFPAHTGSKNSIQRTNSAAEQSPDEGKQRQIQQTVGWREQEREGQRTSGRERLELHRLLRTREMVKMFWVKASWNSLLRTPVYYSPFQDLFAEEGSWLMDKLSLKLSVNVVSLLYICKLICMALYCFLFPLSLLYHEVAGTSTLLVLKWGCLFFSLYDLLQTIQKKCEADGNLNQEKALAFRRRKKMSIGFQLCALVLAVISVGLSCVGVQLGESLFIGPWVGLWHLMEQVHRLQDRFINASQLLKYWRLFGVIMKNLFVCHLLACALIVVAQMHEGNWMTANGIGQLPWQEQYIWSYYFGTTIILTIGFGDLHATNSTEAFLIIVISFFACVFFGYNINYIGNLINSIKQEDNQKNAKLKLLNSLAKKAKVSPQVHQEIARYIIEESKIKQKSDYGEEKRLLKELPQSLRSSFLQEANQKLFNHLRFLIPLGNQTIQRLSLKIQARFCHPDQLIKGQDSPPSLVILQSGEVGYATRSRYPSRLRNAIIERISSKLQSQSRLVCLDLIGQPLSYDIKSLDYSIIYEMERSSFQETIMESKKDYHGYRELLDKCRFKLNEFGLVKCRFCDNNMHTLFECPRVHYQPFRKTLPLKHNNSKLNLKQKRVKFQRNKTQISCEVIMQTKNSRQLQAGLLGSKSMASLEKNNPGRGGKRNSSHLKSRSSCVKPSNENMMMTIQMVTQLRDDIKDLKKPQITHFQFSLWDNVDCDEAANFQYYFLKWNPDTLGEKFIKNTLLTMTSRFRRKAKGP